MRSPSAVIRSINQLLQERAEPDMFVTLFYGLVERATGRMRYVRAGHDRPLLLRSGTVRELDGQGMALGLFSSRELVAEEQEVVLEPGDHLVLYTDGLTDLLSPEGDFFGRQRLQHFLQQHAHLSAAQLCEATFDELALYQSEEAQFDDMTMLVVEVDKDAVLEPTQHLLEIGAPTCATPEESPGNSPC